MAAFAALVLPVLACSSAGALGGIAETPTPYPWPTDLDLSRVRLFEDDFPQTFSGVPNNFMYGTPQELSFPGYAVEIAYGFWENRDGSEAVLVHTGQITPDASRPDAEFIQDPAQYVEVQMLARTNGSTSGEPFIIEVGEAAAGRTTIQPRPDRPDLISHVDVVVFRRGPIVTVVTAWRPEGSIPLAPIDPLAQIIDQRAIELLEGLP